MMCAYEFARYWPSSLIPTPFWPECHPFGPFPEEAFTAPSVHPSPRMFWIAQPAGAS